MLPVLNSNLTMASQFTELVFNKNMTNSSTYHLLDAKGFENITGVYPEFFFLERILLLEFLLDTHLVEMYLIS